jgi:hypothetical protein
MMLHNAKNEDGIKYFLQEAYELYIKVPGRMVTVPASSGWRGGLHADSCVWPSCQVLMNPFYKADTPVTSTVFQKRVKQLGRKYLT